MTKEQLLRQSIDSYSGNTDLPILKLDPSPNWQWLERLFEWIQELMQVKTDAQDLNLPWTFQQISTFLLIVFAGVILIALIVRLINQKQTEVVQSKGSPQRKLPPLEHALESALLDKDFRRASRIAWKLYLQRTKSPAYVTPLEYRCSAETTALAYRGMFGYENSEETYQLWKEQLDQLVQERVTS